MIQKVMVLRLGLFLSFTQQRWAMEGIAFIIVWLAVALVHTLIELHMKSEKTGYQE